VASRLPIVLGADGRPQRLQSVDTLGGIILSSVPQNVGPHPTDALSAEARVGQLIDALAALGLASVVTPTNILEDHFTATNGTNITSRAMDSGQTWSSAGNSITILGNAALASSTTGDGLAYVDVSQDDVTCQAMYWQGTPGSIGDSGGGVMARFTDTSNFLMAFITAFDNTFRLQVVQSGTLNILDQVRFVLIGGHAYTITLSVSGTVARARMTGAARDLTASLPGGFPTSTKGGFILETGGGGVRPQLDDFYLTSP